MKRKRSKSKKIIPLIIFLLVLIGLFLGGYFFLRKPSSSNHHSNSNSIKEEEKPQLKILDLNSKSRSIAVMINNLKVAQPYQTGLNDAYLVYEIITEGGITRLLAVYKDAKDTTTIGTIRSSRHYFIDYAVENDAIYTHFGYSNKAKEDISRRHIDNINGLVDDNFYWRDKSLPVASEHTVYTNISKLQETITNKKYRNTTTEKPLLSYSVDPIDLTTKEDSIPASNVLIKFSNYQTTEFTYDPETKLYTRKSNNEVRSDYLTKEPFTTKNILTYQIKNYSYDSYGRQELENIGRGEGYYITNGYALKINWEKSSEDAKTKYTYPDGSEVIFNDGETYIEIQPQDQTLTLS